MPSSVIKGWRYDPEDAVLTITFVSGRAYAYQAVPAHVAEGFRLAFAKGEYFNRAIRDRYPAIRAVAAEPTQPSLL